MKELKPRKRLGLSFFTYVITLLFATGLAQAQDLELFKGMKARSIGPAGMSGRVTSIDVVTDNPQVMYVGTASGGLWKSESGGISWKPLFDKEKVASIGAVAVFQANPDIIWAGTGEGNPRNSQTSGAGIYLSRDGGETWELKGLEKTRNIHRVIIHPNNPDIVYVGVQGSAWGEHPERGVYKTTDGGETWNKILYVNEKTGVGDMVIDPKNPEKLIVGMWEFRRWPWFFKSGGEGSGLYVTHDGGKTWKERTSEDGLPKGELGRIGLAIAQNRPNVVYAIVESKKNALYRSDDGGKKWHMVNDKPEIGNRPFYYADIYLDPQNENRIYSLYSMVSMSEDGGKSFKVIVPYSGVHPDHHAFWVHPENPDFMMLGNDGGMAISHDLGKNWRFVTNLPLAQYYHINVDNETPYNVYGGMQDNGSWRGPAYVWRANGIRNSYFEEVMFGDGFDVMPDPEQPNRYGYAMSQGGSLGRYDLVSGHRKGIKPVHPEGKTLRFNWNSAIAQDPFDTKTIYYGSQYVHKSTDKGETWSIISPDLTTNDTSKHKQLESGGLTYDATQAENFTTIIAIEPSPLKEGMIWVGSDDGKLHLTQDGGETWKDLTNSIKGVPAGSWIPQVKASKFNEGEAFVLFNNYRRNDWSPFVFQTKDFGKSWTRIVDENKVWGYALSFVQDLEEPNLMFLGTEFGLYVSFDAGQNWKQWTHGYPTVSTMDMVIQPKEHDLVIGTFGRAAYVLDDIRPLREVAKEKAVLDKEIHAFAAPDAYLAVYGQASGMRFGADATFAGENRPFGAMLSYFVKEGNAKDAEKKEKAKIEVFDASGKLIRTLKPAPETGLNRVQWELDVAGVRFPSTSKPKKESGENGGFWVKPGEYKVKMTWKESSDSTTVKVLGDPRIELSTQDIEARYDALEEMSQKVAEVTKSTDKLIEALEAIDLVLKQLPSEGENVEEIKAESDSIKNQITELKELVFSKEGLQGIVRSPTILSARLRNAYYMLSGSLEAPNANQLNLVKSVEKEAEEVMGKIDAFFENEWEAYEAKVGEISLSPFHSLIKAMDEAVEKE